MSVDPVVNLYLDGPTAAPTDVTTYARNTSVRRGRSRELDTFPAGSATIVLQNRDRRFDPTYTAGPYYNRIKPRIRVQITSEEIPIFDGWVEDIDFAYDVSSQSETVLKCVDGLAKLGQTTLSAFTNTQQTPEQRIQAVLARPEVGYSGSVDLDPGFNVLQADTVADATNTLNYLQTVAATDSGRLFVDGGGVLRFRDRTTGITESARVIFGTASDPYVQQLGLLSEATLWFDAKDVSPVRIDAAALGAVVLQDATLWFDASDPSYIAPVIPFNDVDLVYGSEFLYNRITITRSGGTAQVSSSVDSQASYGIRALAQDGLLFLSDAEAASFGDYLLTQFQSPKVRVGSHRVVLDGLSTVQARYVKRLEIGDVVRTVWTPNATGAGFDISSFVEGVEHNIDPARHEVVLQLTPFTVGGFILDSVNSGLLDTSVMTY